MRDHTAIPRFFLGSPYPSLAALLVLGLLFSASSAAGVERWSPLGPGGGEVSTLFASSSQPDTVYAGMVRGGVFRSLDGGRSWHAFSEGMTVSRVYDLDEGPDRVLYAATHTGIYRRLPGATLWQRASGGLSAPFDHVLELLADPSVPGRLYASVQRGLTAGPVLFVSEDGGDQWTENQSAFSAQAIALLATTPPTLVVAGSAGVQISDPESDVWELHVTGLPTFPTFLSLEAHPSDGTILYASIQAAYNDRTRLYKSEDGGRSWRVADIGLPDEVLNDNSPSRRLWLDPRNPSTVFAGSLNGLYRSDDGAATWRPIRQAPANVSSLSFAALPDGNLLQGSPTVEGVLRSVDGGDAWEVIGAGFLGRDMWAISPDPERPGRVVAAGDGGLLFSDDDGLSWQAPRGNFHTMKIRRHPLEASTLLAPGPGSLHRSLDGGASWQTHGPPTPEAVPSLEWDATGEELYGTTAGAVWRSLDGGLTWSNLSGLICSGDLPGVLYLAPPRVDGSLVAGCIGQHTINKDFPSFEASLLHSVDGGRTWSVTRDDLGGSFLGEWHFSRGDRTGTLLASLTSPGAGQLLRSDSGGLRWTDVPDLDFVQFQTMVADGIRPGRLLAGTSELGVLESLDDGLTWHPMNDGLLSGRVASLAFDGIDATRAWAATGSGVHALGEAPLCVPSATGLCLLDRFRAEVSWTDFEGNSGQGMAVPLTDNTGAFWFFGESNLELAMKVLDGRDFNDHYWLFYGGLSTVRYTLTVTDLSTGVARIVENPSGQLTGAADTSAFPATDSALQASELQASVAQVSAFQVSAFQAPATDLLELVTEAGSNTSVPKAAEKNEPLRLQADRFELVVHWRTQDGASGLAGSTQLSSDTGAFYFFDPDNLEIFVKVLDGRPVNGRFWLFFTGLSDVAYDLEITDTETGASRTYSNLQGSFGGLADTELF